MTSRRRITPETARIYEQYFNVNVFNDVNWAPSITCTTCLKNLHQWSKGAVQSMPFGVPVMWTDPIIHDHDECYACVNFVSGTNRPSLRTRVYHATKFAQLPLPHSDSIPIPKRPSPTEESAAPTFMSEVGDNPTSLYEPSNITPKCKHVEITQKKLNNIARGLKLSQRRSIMLAQYLNEAKILAPDVRIFSSVGRHQQFSDFFTSIENNSLAYCNDIRGMIEMMHEQYAADEWRLFIDASRSSLKAVLLHVKNEKPSIPIALSTRTKETYASLKQILELVEYEEHRWKVCADLKVITLLRGMQTGYTKNMCFMCLWDTRYQGDQYSVREWPLREHIRLRQNNIVETPLVPVEKMLLPPLHIKLGLVKNFIKALNKQGPAFTEIQRIFPRLSAMKIKEGLCLIRLFQPI